MELPRRMTRRPQWILFFVALGVLCTGVMYYLIFRSQGDVLAAYWPWIADYRNSISDPTAGSLPGLLHMIALGCCATALLGMSRGCQMIAVLLAITIIAEFAVGAFHWGDIYFALVGSLLAVVMSALVYQAAKDDAFYAQQQLTASTKRKYAAGLVASSVLFIAATAPCYMCGSYPSSTPVYLSYTALRSAVAVGNPREPDEIRRIYLYQNYIFLNKKNEGIHVLDNVDPTNPVNVAFINIPGNTELSIRDNYLYADSYVDLVTLSLNDPANIEEVDRQIDVFPWDEYQNVPDDIYFSPADLDSNRGVVVSYENQ